MFITALLLIIGVLQFIGAFTSDGKGTAIFATLLAVLEIGCGIAHWVGWLK